MKKTLSCTENVLFFIPLLIPMSYFFLAGIYTQEDLHEFLREAEIMQSFDHENVVKLLGRSH